MNLKQHSIVLIISVFNSITLGYAQTTDKKAGEIYAQQKQIANELAAKTALTPITLPDPQKMISINESGDGVVSLPVVSVKGRKLVLPINISYSAGGIKAEQNSGEVGLGWNIAIGSIIRDYGPFEPDYSYTGSEFKMLRDNGATVGSTVYDKKLRSLDWMQHPTTHAWSVGAARYFIPSNQNKVMDYNACEGKAPDNYILNIPGVGQNDFWNSEGTVPAYGVAPPSPTFVFSEKVPWKISYDTATFTVSQELSRINEFNYKNTVLGTLDGNQGNKSSAIGLLPYVVAQQYTCVFNRPYIDPMTDQSLRDIWVPAAQPWIPSPNMKVKYQDYSKFVITTTDGTKYVFGRPLRGQKYLYDEEPFWSSMKTTSYLAPDGFRPDDVVYNELWKTDYIAEWLLTEIKSSDYLDVNGNGIPDDGDNGDWIKIDYTDPILIENIAGLTLGIPEPKHREFLNITQTDRQSSIWRERAYITKITTPIEVVEFGNSQRFDVNHDYFKSPFNRVNNIATYDCRYIEGGSIGISGTDPTTGAILSPEIIENNTCVNYPIQLRKYDWVSVKNQLGELVQNVKLNYAAQGSPQELAVSNYLILGNDGIFTEYDPNNLGFGVSAANFWKTTGRGKTTLLSIDYRGNDFASANKISYSFEYGFNPSLNNIHLFDIYQKLSSPTLRESLRNTERWTGIKTLTPPGTPPAIYKIPNSILPWKTIEVSRDWNATALVGPGTIPFTSDENNGNPVYVDEFGYYFNNSLPNKGRDAWSLTKINLPMGGSVSLSYERDQVDITNDRKKWEIPDYCLPHVGHYNNVAHMRSLLQRVNNQSFVMPPLYPMHHNYMRTYKEYYFLMNDNSGGLRLKQIDVADNYGSPTISKKYQYGPGHYTAPPGEYFDNYIKGFGEFMQNEFKRHGNTDENGEYESYGDGGFPPDFCEYKESMMRLATQLRIDNSYRKHAKHYYEYIDEVNNDNSKTRWKYGKIYVPTSSASRLVYIPMVYSTIKNGFNDRFNVLNILSTNLNNSGLDLGNYATEMYNSAGNIVNKNSSDYSYVTTALNTITTSAVTLPSKEYYAYLPWIFQRCFELSMITDCRELYSGLTPMPSGGLSSNFELEITATPDPNVIEAPTLFISYMDRLETGGFSSPQAKILYEGIPNSLLQLLGYIPPASPISTAPVSSVAEANNTFLKIAVQSGLYNSAAGIPAWFNSISSQPKAWLGTYSDIWVSDVLTSGIEDVRKSNIRPTCDHIPGSEYTHSYWKDVPTLIPGASFSRQRSYNMRLFHTQTISNFY